MGFGSSGNSGQLQQQQNATNNRINAGTQEINTIFDGGTYGSNPQSLGQWSPQQFVGVPQGGGTSTGQIGGMFLGGAFGDPLSGSAFGSGIDGLLGGGNSTSWIPSQWLGGNMPNGAQTVTRKIPLPLGQTFYGANGQPIQSNVKDYQSLLRKAQNGILYQGTQTSKGFGPAFYNDLTQAYINSNEPALQQQFNNTKNQLGFKLADQGLLHSSAGQQLGSSLDRQLGQNQITLGNQALSATQNLQQQIEGERSRLIAQLQASSNPAQAQAEALRAASQFATPSITQPIGQMFSDWANAYLGGQQNNLYGGAGQQLGFGSPISRQLGANPLPTGFGNY